MGKKLTQEEFIRRAREVHGKKYDYSKVEYKNCETKVCIICPKHGEFWQTPSKHLCDRGCPKCKSQKLKTIVYGIGNFDEFGSATSRAYISWVAMLQRCYRQRPTESTYLHCSVVKEWHTFSAFRKWFEDPENGYQEGYSLDKDIILKGNKVYSPETCCFVPREINALLTKRQNHRGSCPIGVSFNINKQKFESNISKYGKQHYLGAFGSKDAAFRAYKVAKEQYIKELAEKYFQEGRITKKVYDALMKYEVEITD